MKTEWLQSISDGPWMMTEAGLRAFAANLAIYAGKGDGTDKEDGGYKVFSVSGSVARVQIAGPMMTKLPPYMKALRSRYGIAIADMQELGQVISALDEDPAISEIVLEIDSPGGAVIGTQSLGEVINATSTPIRTEARGVLGSAAYWIASQSDSISAAPDAMVGSIGVFTYAYDMSAMAEGMGIKVHVISTGGVKGAGVPGAPISDEALADMQRIVDTAGSRFVEAVASGRGMTEDEAKALATGQVYFGPEAQALGLVDEIITPAPKERATTTERSTAVDAQEMKALADAHPKHAALIIALAADGKPSDEILAEINDTEAKAEKASLIARAEKAEAERDEAKAQAADSASKLEAVEAERDAIKAELDDIKAFRAGGTKDPGPDHQQAGAKVITESQLNAMSGKARAEFFAAGGKVIPNPQA